MIETRHFHIALLVVRSRKHLLESSVAFVMEFLINNLLHPPIGCYYINSCSVINISKTRAVFDFRAKRSVLAEGANYLEER